ncbi:heme-dependent oxidative N-demethylase family protein [Henriciella litoralis]|uniref:heme-dependent oxidative N-demethylase family protein n=1 Tax=Henriciella litoralis TaxID=568102 RepID=UPI00111C3C8B|nr:DUF3445 domain-containing protein [Henriciella litoralis]
MPHRQPPYLPFLLGPPRVAPGLRPIAERQWLMPDSEADEWLLAKQILMENQPDDTVLGDIDGRAAFELLAMVGEASGLRTCEDWTNPLAMAAALVSDDLCLLERDEDGEWVLEAGAVAAPTYWRLSEQIGLTLGGLHGPVPGGDPQLARRINRIFDGLGEGKVLERFNWTVQAGNARYTPVRPDASGADPEDLHLRVERQTIRKLPETGAVCFTIRVCLDPLLPILRDDDLREAFEDAWIGTDRALRAYKGWDDLEHLVREACLQSAATG